jgi:hypothetical protein
MSNQLTRRDFAIRIAGFGLALGLAPAATLAEAEQASRSKTPPAVADPYSLVDPELLPALKQFPAFDFSAEMVREFRKTPGMPPLPGPAPQRNSWSCVVPFMDLTSSCRTPKSRNNSARVGSLRCAKHSPLAKAKEENNA